MAYTKSKDEQMVIARQSQIKVVLDWSISCGKCLTLKELVGITNVFADYVSNGYSKELENRLLKVQEHLDNKDLEIED